MKLYYSKAACSLASHIALREAGVPFDLEAVNLQTKTTASGADFKQINNKGYVPTLQLDNGTVLTEGPAILQYIADQHPAAKLAPANGTFERSRLQEWLNFITAELHKNYSPLFNPAVGDSEKQRIKTLLANRIAIAAQQLESSPYLLGADYSLADIYLFVVLSWSRMVNVDLSAWPVLEQFSKTIAQRPAVQAALKAEGLM
jgi:glutathione S-transferase